MQALSELPRARGRVLTWPVATAFGFLARADRHLLLKPRVTDKAAHVYGFDLAYLPQPDWRGYERLLTFAAIVRRDMIDVQSFMWVQGAPEYAA